MEEWSPQAMVWFIKALPRDLGEGQLRELDETLGLSVSRNAEIARAWFIEVASRKHRPAYNDMRLHLGRYGRTHLVRPVYQALIKNGEDLDFAEEIFAAERDNYHPLTVAAIQALFDARN